MSCVFELNYIELNQYYVCIYTNMCTNKFVCVWARVYNMCCDVWVVWGMGVDVINKYNIISSQWIQIWNKHVNTGIIE